MNTWFRISFFYLIFDFSKKSVVEILFPTFGIIFCSCLSEDLLSWESKFAVSEDFPRFDIILYSCPVLMNIAKSAIVIPLRTSRNGDDKVNKYVEISSLLLNGVELMLL